jgi:PEP-CTERM motif-containing protein
MCPSNRVVCAMVLISMVSFAHATVLEYQVDANFDDGGQAVGSFAFERTVTHGSLQMSLLKLNITTTAVPPTFPSLFVYTLSNSGISFDSPGVPLDAVEFATHVEGPSQYLYFAFDPGLANGVLTANIFVGFETFGDVARHITSGTVTAVPEPSTVSLIALGLLILLRRFVRWAGDHS